MTSLPGSSHLPARRQERRNAGTVALTGPPAPLLGPVGGSIIKWGLFAPPASVPSLQDNQHGFQTGPVLGISSIASLETQPFFYAGKEACA
jgi:hypothetical protein